MPYNLKISNDDHYWIKTDVTFKDLIGLLKYPHWWVRKNEGARLTEYFVILMQSLPPAYREDLLIQGIDGTSVITVRTQLDRRKLNRRDLFDQNPLRDTLHIVLCRNRENDRHARAYTHLQITLKDDKIGANAQYIAEYLTRAQIETAQFIEWHSDTAKGPKKELSRKISIDGDDKSHDFRIIFKPSTYPVQIVYQSHGEEVEVVKGKRDPAPPPPPPACSSNSGFAEIDDDNHTITVTIDTILVKAYA